MQGSRAHIYRRGNLSSATSRKCHFPLVPLVRGVVRNRLQQTRALHASVDESDTYPCLRLVRQQWITQRYCCEHTAQHFAARMAQSATWVAHRCARYSLSDIAMCEHEVGAIARHVSVVSHCVTRCCAHGGSNVTRVGVAMMFRRRSRQTRARRAERELTVHRTDLFSIVMPAVPPGVLVRARTRRHRGAHSARSPLATLHAPRIRSGWLEGALWLEALCLPQPASGTAGVSSSLVRVRC